MNLVAKCGCVKTVPMNDRQLHRCPEHDETFVHSSALKPRKPLRRVSEKKAPAARRSGSTLKSKPRRETAAEKRARLQFNKIVKGWPCWFRATRACEQCEGEGQVAKSFGIDSSGQPEIVTCPVCEGDGKHRCKYPKDAHHLIPKDFIRQRYRGIASEQQLLAVLFSQFIGAPLCRKAHEAVEAGSDRIYWEDLSEECLAYVSGLPDFMLLRLERECPKRSPVQTEVRA